MDIRILHYLEGAAQAEGIAVVIDVFRAFTTAVFFAENGAERIIPVDDIALAYQLKARNPDYLLAGERGGMIQEGFDYGNSPAAIENRQFAGKTIVITTSAGTQGLAEAAKHADEVITGSFVNAAAAAEWIRSRSPGVVSLICMGWNGREPADEDTLYAEYLQGLLTGNPKSFSETADFIRNESTTMHFLKTGVNSAEAQRDFDLCLSLDRAGFVLRVRPGSPMELVQETP